MVKDNKFQKRINDTQFAYLICTPMLLYISVVVLYPVLWGVSLSFTDKSIGGIASFVGFDNYGLLLHDGQFRRAVFNTLLYTICSVSGKLLFGLIMALTLNINMKGRNLFRALLIIPWTLPNIVAVLNWRWIFSDTGGAANHILKTFGLINKDLIWLGDPALAMIVVFIVNIWRGTPFFGISILAKLQTIPDELYEAADIDGASGVQKFLYVSLPSIIDVMLLTSLVSSIWTINEFESVWLLTGGGPSGATELVGVYSYRTAMSGMLLGRGVAISVMVTPVLLILIHFISRMMLGSPPSKKHKKDAL
jgi:multiple sugar transport system permease protein